MRVKKSAARDEARETPKDKLTLGKLVIVFSIAVRMSSCDWLIAPEHSWKNIGNKYEVVILNKTLSELRNNSIKRSPQVDNLK